MEIGFFAYSTILGWAYCGEKCAAYVFGNKFVSIYRLVYVATVMFGTVVSLDLVWAATDTFNGNFKFNRIDFAF